MRAEDIKARVSVEDILTHHGSTKDKNGKWRCLIPSNHTNGDAHHSVDPYQRRAFCRSHECFGPKGLDIFGIVGLLESLSNFTDQKAWIEKTFGLNHHKPKPLNILRAFEWTDAEGRAAYHLRLDKENKKFTWNQQADGSGAWTLEPCKPDLYQRDQVIAAQSVIVGAGERDCDTMNGWLKDLGKYPAIVATCNHTGENCVKAKSFHLLHGKQMIYVIGDNDTTGESYRVDVCGFLRGKVDALYTLQVPPQVNDITEWAENGATAEDFAQLLASATSAPFEEHAVEQFTPRKATEEKPHNGCGGNESHATQLIKLVEGCELFHDEEARAYASVHVDDRVETWPLRRKGFKTWLARQYFIRHKKAPGSQAVQDALGVLEGRAQYEGEVHQVFTRVGGDNSEVYLDLGDDLWNMVKITRDGWKVVPHGHEKFKRGTGMKALPRPVSGGNLKALLSPFINLTSENDWTLLMGFLMAAIRPTGPQLILELNGEQGSGKSTSLDVFKTIIDPNKAAKRTQPRDERDLMIGASNNWLVSLDNLSGLPAWLSDALCRLSTGGALATRTLYSDEDETLFEAKRPIILNGIGSVATRPDLLDRTIVLTLPTIPEGQRRPEREFWADFQSVSGQILGALCDAVSCALRNLKTTKPKVLGRMADAIIWVTAAEGGMGEKSGAFQQAYQENRDSGNETALESSVLYGPIRQLLEKDTRWEETIGELLVALSDIVGERKASQKQWPTNPRGLRSALERIIPNLRGVGIQVTFAKERTQKGRLVLLEYCGNEPSQHTQPSQPQKTLKKSVTVDDGLSVTDDGSQASTVTKNHNKTNDHDGHDDDDGHLHTQAKEVDADLFEAEGEELHVDV